MCSVNTNCVCTYSFIQRPKGNKAKCVLIQVEHEYEHGNANGYRTYMGYMLITAILFDIGDNS